MKKLKIICNTIIAIVIIIGNIIAVCYLSQEIGYGTEKCYNILCILISILFITTLIYKSIDLIGTKNKK